MTDRQTDLHDDGSFGFSREENNINFNVMIFHSMTLLDLFQTETPKSIFDTGDTDYA